MAGRYPQNVVKHPGFDEAVAASVENEQQHIDNAKNLKPRWLNKEESKVWMRIGPELSKAGRLKKLFVDFIGEYCVIWCRIQQARKTLDDEDWEYVTVGRHGTQIKSRPAVAQYNDDWRKLNSLVAQLGLSPATELRFKSGQLGLFDDDEFGNI